MSNHRTEDFEKIQHLRLRRDSQFVFFCTTCPDGSSGGGTPAGTKGFQMKYLMSCAAGPAASAAGHLILTGKNKSGLRETTQKVGGKPRC